MDSRTDVSTRNHLTDGEVLALDEKLEELRSNAGFQELLELIAAGRERFIDETIHGGPFEQAQYAERMGYLAGLELFTNHVERVGRAATKVRKELQREADQARAAETGEPELGFAPDGVTENT